LHLRGRSVQADGETASAALVSASIRHAPVRVDPPRGARRRAKRDRSQTLPVGFLSVWTILLVVSTIAAPMLGKLGTPATGTIGPHATDLITWIVTAVAIALGAAALAWPRLRSRRS
jgi:hypothetical protein